MKERSKTILLFSLVCMSVFFTQKLWIQLPGEMFKVFEPTEVISDSYALSDMIAPNKYLLNFGQKNHTLEYDDSKYGVWNNSRSVLTEILGSDTITVQEITKDQYLSHQEERSLVFHFPEVINTYILAKTWDVKDPNTIADTIPNIDDIYIYLGNGNPFFVFSGENKYLAVYDETINNVVLKDQLAEIENTKDYDYYYSMKETYKIDNDIYIPYEMKNKLSIAYVSNEIPTLEPAEKSNLAERFLEKDIDYIREIVEGNGSTIYVYDNRVLKLNINGTIEYFHALEENSSKRNLYMSLSTVADFITQKINSKKGMYLASIEDIESDNNQGYKLTFRYRIRGIPVLLGNREVGDYIQIEVFNNHIRSYKQLTRREMDMGLSTIIENRKMLSSFDVLDKNYDFLERKYLQINNKTKEEIGENIVQEVLSSIDDITLSYYDPNLKDKSEKLIGVWAIRADEKIYAFNVFTGNLVFER